MFYNKNSPFYSPELINYDEDTKSYKYMIKMKETDEVKYFICVNDQKERKRCGYLFSMSKRGRLTLTEKHIKRFIYCGLLYNFDNHTKLIDIFTIKKTRKKKYTDEEKKEKAKIRSKIHYHKKINKDLSNNLIEKARFYNLKIPIIQVN